jgi:hypothetical protein
MKHKSVILIIGKTMKNLTLILFSLIQLSLYAQTSIEIISPNGGETYQAGDTLNIRWFDDLVEPIKIELFKNDILYLEIEDNTPSDGIFDWVIPYEETGGPDYKIKITSTQFTTKFDFSDSNFTIITNEVTVTSPSAGDNWQAGTSHTITWVANFDDNVFVTLFKGGSFYRLISSSTENDGSFQWTIAFDEIGDSDYQIRIGSLINSAVSDFSDFFTITPNEITVISPNGAEEWYAGTTETITWNSNFTGDVEIQLYKNDSFHSSIVTSVPNNGSYIWNIPDTTSSGIDYKVMILFLADNDVFDFSDDYFNIIKIDSITVIAPNGGEVWCGGDAQNIIWEDNLSGNVEIDLFKGSAFHSVLVPSTPSDGFYSWSVPSGFESGSDYLIKILSVNNSDVFDFSDTTFTIGCNIVVTSPNGGEVWQIGSTQDIDWSSISVIDVKIELSLNNGASWLTIIDSTLSTGNYSWVVASPQPSHQCVIRISDITNENIADQSDNVFIIDDTSNENEELSNIPESYELLQNYPNPFNSSTTIYYGLPEESSIEIIIYDVLGNQLMIYSEEKLPTGYHQLEFNATEFGSGIYFYRLQASLYIILLLLCKRRSLNRLLYITDTQFPFNILIC